RATPVPDLFSSLFTHPGLLRTFHRLHGTFDGGGTRLQRESLLLRFVGELITRLGRARIPAAVGRERHPVRRAKGFLREQFDQEVSLQEWSSLVRLSPYYLNRVFAAEVGIPPHAYQIQLRLLHAKALLRENEPLARVASATGFADQSHFTRYFKRLA